MIDFGKDAISLKDWLISISLYFFLVTVIALCLSINADDKNKKKQIAVQIVEKSKKVVKRRKKPKKVVKKRVIKQKKKTDIKRLFKNINLDKFKEKKRTKKVKKIIDKDENTTAKKEVVKYEKKEFVALGSVGGTSSLKTAKTVPDLNLANLDKYSSDQYSLGLDDEVIQEVYSILLMHWQETASIMSKNQARVEIDISKDGKLSFNVLKLSRDSFFNSKLNAYLNKMKTVKFPKLKEKDMLKLDIMFKDNLEVKGFTDD